MKDKILTWNVDPVIYWITDTFPLKYYGILFATGLMLGYLIVKKIYQKENIPVENLEKLSTYIVIGTLLGARLGHCFFYDFSYYSHNLIEILLPIKRIGDTYKFIGFQGLASHGGAIGVLTAIIIYSRKYKTDLFWILDRVAIAVPVAGAFIRLGNFMNSEIYGKPTNGNWGVIFQKDDLIPRHPTQLYEASAYLLIFGILLLLYKSEKFKKPNGVIFGIFLTLLFTARFMIEFFKENQVNFENEMIINMGQVLSIPFILTGLIIIFLKRKNPVHNNS
jgi:prolipoprotein diacylglyceryl transferase